MVVTYMGPVLTPFLFKGQSNTAEGGAFGGGGGGVMNIFFCSCLKQDQRCCKCFCMAAFTYHCVSVNPLYGAIFILADPNQFHGNSWFLICMYVCAVCPGLKYTLKK